jgi:hypothetical protein
MGIIFFKQTKAKRFNYIPRFYDPAKEERERRRAALGLNDDIDSDDLRTRMRARWHKKIPVEKGPKYTPLSLIIYAVVIFGGIYIIFFTRLIDNMIRAFGLIN